MVATLTGRVQLCAQEILRTLTSGVRTRSLHLRTHVRILVTVAASGFFREPDLAEALGFRDELLIACRAVLLGVATTHASALVAHIHTLLDLDDERSPGSTDTSAPRDLVSGRRLMGDDRLPR